MPTYILISDKGSACGTEGLSLWSWLWFCWNFIFLLTHFSLADCDGAMPQQGRCHSILSCASTTTGSLNTFFIISVTDEGAWRRKDRRRDIKSLVKFITSAHRKKLLPYRVIEFSLVEERKVKSKIIVFLVTFLIAAVMTEERELLKIAFCIGNQSNQSQICYGLSFQAHSTGTWMEWIS